MVKGAPYVLGKARLSQRVVNADLVITGEGRIDGQTAMGKAPQAVAAVARQYGVPVVAICGAVDPDVDAAKLGFDRIIPVTPADMPLEQAIKQNEARQNICRAITSLLLSVSR
jgi:glycerate kinase